MIKSPGNAWVGLWRFRFYVGCCWADFLHGPSEKVWDIARVINFKSN